MTRPSLMLLPGLDGTGDLFEAFVAAAPRGFDCRIVRLPNDRPRGYAELADWLCRAIGEKPVVLIGESFSGPLALLAGCRSANVHGLVLVASFVQSPFPALLRRIPKALLGAAPPDLLLALLLTGGDRALARSSRRAAAESDPAVIAERVSALLNVDVAAQLAQLSKPLLYIQATADRLIPRRCLAQIVAINPSVQVARVAGPHLILQSRPYEAWRALEPFLERSLQV